MPPVDCGFSSLCPHYLEEKQISLTGSRRPHSSDGVKNRNKKRRFQAGRSSDGRCLKQRARDGLGLADVLRTGPDQTTETALGIHCRTVRWLRSIE